MYRYLCYIVKQITPVSPVTCNSSQNTNVIAVLESDLSGEEGVIGEVDALDIVSDAF